MAYTIGSTINSNFHGQPIPKVHDSFWTHASDVPLLNESIRVPGQRVNVVSCDLKRGPTRNQSLPGGFLLGGRGFNLLCSVSHFAFFLWLTPSVKVFCSALWPWKDAHVTSNLIPMWPALDVRLLNRECLRKSGHKWTYGDLSGKISEIACGRCQEAFVELYEKPVLQEVYEDACSLSCRFCRGIQRLTPLTTYFFMRTSSKDEFDDISNWIKIQPQIQDRCKYIMEIDVPVHAVRLQTRRGQMEIVLLKKSGLTPHIHYSHPLNIPHPQVYDPK